MANKQRAEVEVSGSSGDKYVFKLGSGAICQLEDTLDLSVNDLFETLNSGKVKLKTVREFVKAASVPAVEDERANEIIDDCGVLPLLAAMTDSVLATFNVGKEDKKNPPKPVSAKKAAGSGVSSGPQKLAS